MLLSAEESGRLIDELASYASRCWCYSAFVTTQAVHLVTQSFRGSGRLLLRGRVDDFVSGASDLNALREALAAGWDVRISTAIHMKVYFFDEDMVTGSSNLTSKGLALTPNFNEELNVRTKIDSSDIELADVIWEQAIPISEADLVKMEEYLLNFDSAYTSEIPLLWSPEIVSKESRNMYCADFPQASFEKGCSSFSVKSYADLSSSIPYQWLVKAVEENRGSINFGGLSARLHNDVYDDPAPYRREIKDLIANLLSYIEVLDDEVLHVTRPRHSQIVSMRNS
jgi:hypothetical protein